MLWGEIGYGVMHESNSAPHLNPPLPTVTVAVAGVAGILALPVGRSDSDAARIALRAIHRLLLRAAERQHERGELFFRKTPGVIALIVAA